MTRKAWQRIQLARKQERPKALDLIPHLFDHFIEFHGDRYFGDDRALIGGIAYFEGIPVTVLAQSKGRNLEENLASNFGMCHPEGYRKSYRLAQQAAKFNRPIITLIDTAGAYPGQGAEERGQAEAIAKNLHLFSMLETPIIALILSEGGSGGALALGLADRVYMMENAIYSILSPEGFASILWKDESRAQEAAELMECTAPELLSKKIIDGIIQEPEGGFETNIFLTLTHIKDTLRQELKGLRLLKKSQLITQRHKKYRSFGSKL